MSTADEVVVTHCCPADMRLVEDLFIAYRHFYGCKNDERQAVAFLRARITQGESYVLTARAADHLVGFFQIYKEFSSLCLALTWVLNDLFVAPETRGIGAGRALVEYTLREARSAGATAVVLETKIDNGVAQSLYRSIGFLETHRNGEFVHFRHDLEGAAHV